MKKFLGKLSKVLGGTVLGLLVLAVLAGLSILRWPGLVLNDSNLERAARWLNTQGMEVKWRTGHIDVESHGLWRKVVKLDFNDVCVKSAPRDSDGVRIVETCFDQAQIVAEGSLKNFRPKLVTIGPLNLQGGQLLVNVPPEPQSKTPAPKEEDTPFKFPAFLVEARVLPIQLGVNRFELRTDKTQLVASVNWKSRANEKEQVFADAQVEVQLPVENERPHRFQSALQLENPKGPWSLESWRGRGQSTGQLSDGTDLTLQARANPRRIADELSFDYLLDGTYKKGRGEADVHARGSASLSRVDAQLSATVKNLVPSLDLLRLQDCHASMARVSSEREPGKFQVNCPVRFKVPVLPKGFPDLKLPTETGVVVSADLKTGAYPPTPSDFVDGDVSLELEPVMTSIFSGEGKVDAKVKGVPTDYPEGLALDTDLALQLRVPHFEKLVKQLANTAVDIWAPLRVLKGQMDIGLSGKFDSESGSAPIQLTTRLESELQKFNIDAKGTLKVLRLRPRPATHLDLDVLLSDVRLELPPLPSLPTPTSPAPDALPRYFPDDRIHVPEGKEALKAQTVPVFAYDIAVRTPDGAHPVRLVSPQTRTPIPLGVDVQVSNSAPPLGTIRVMQFPLELFRRNVTLDHLSVGLRDPSQESTLDGLVTVPYTDYTVSILLLGTTSKPEVRFLSDPPLPEDQIYATLLFGQPLEALDSDQRKSVGDSRAALREGALNLFSLYYLSSLNIESIDYDPGSNIASLKFRLAEGTSLNLVQGSTQTTVGVRKRLSKHLSITTALNNYSSVQSTRTVSTFLEWAYQY